MANITTVGAATLFASLLVAGVAHAEAFTFTSKNNDDTVQLSATVPGGPAAQGAYWTSVNEATYPDGRKVKETVTCISASQPPTDRIFMLHGICETKAPDGTFASTWGCNALNEEGTKIGCVGGLYGKTGVYEGKRGSATFHGTSEGTGKGTGQWYD